MTEKSVWAKPFVRWAGGKKQLLPQLLPLLGVVRFERYMEPFLGGGALFFALANRKQIGTSILNDSNSELMDLWQSIQNRCQELIKAVEQLLAEHPVSEEGYYAVRSSEPEEMVDRAARTLYLNRTNFNGLYRVNKDGGFNAPYGRWPEDRLPTVLNKTRLEACSKSMHEVGTLLTNVGFEKSFPDDVGPGDLVYMDPPYIPVTSTSFADGYTRDGFSLQDHERLAKTFLELTEKGATVILSNSDTPLTRKLYEGFRILEVQGRRNINSKGDARGPVSEVIVLGQRG